MVSDFSSQRYLLCFNRSGSASSPAVAWLLRLQPKPLRPVVVLDGYTPQSSATETNLRGEGLPGRPWYKNQIYAPGAYTGYGVKTLAGVREAMDQHQWSIAEQESPIIGNVLEAESRAIDAAAGRLEAAFSSTVVTQTAPSATFR